MKANELMIGDYVSQKESNLILKVSKVNPPYIEAEGEGGQFHENTLQAIPLTKEILEKNGFKFDEFPKYAVNEIKEKTKVLFTYHSGSRTVFVSINEPNFKLLSDMVIWVHELQHILRHARIEKEIEL